MATLKTILPLIIIALFCVIGCGEETTSKTNNTKQQGKKTADTDKNKEYFMSLSEEEWKKRLDPEAYRILREKGTERAFTGEYNDNKKEGTYACGGCGQELFTSDSKYDSGSGWPSFFKPVIDKNISYEEDGTAGMVRVEILCSKCNGHLGHVFEDGPKPTGKRYCVNSKSLQFKPKE